MTTTYTREQWLNKCAKHLAPLFERAGYTVPKNIRVSCGWPGGGSRNKRIGECWSNECSEDGHFEIFISPVLADARRVGDVLAHEMVHAVVGLAAGHGAAFKACARAIGLTGKMTATTGTPELHDHIAKISRDYPHGRMAAGTTGQKKQSTRLLKAECPDCGYTIRVTAKWASIGMPTCCCGGEMELAQ